MTTTVPVEHNANELLYQADERPPTRTYRRSGCSIGTAFGEQCGVSPNDRAPRPPGRRMK